MDAVAGTGARDTFRPDIEGLRGIAILLVVVFHAGLLGLSRRLHRRRRLLRHLGLPDHPQPGPGAEQQRHHPDRTVLRAPGPSAAAGRPRGRPGHARGVVRRAAAARPAERRPRRRVHRPPGQQHPVRDGRGRLLRLAGVPVALPPLLGARGRGPVLPRLACADPRCLRRPTAPVGGRHRPWRPGGGIARFEPRAHRLRCQLGLLLTPDAGLAVRARRHPRHRPGVARADPPSGAGRGGLGRTGRPAGHSRRPGRDHAVSRRRWPSSRRSPPSPSSAPG